MNLLPFQYVNQLQLLLESNNKLILLMFQLFVLCTQAGIQDMCYGTAAQYCGHKMTVASWCLPNLLSVAFVLLLRCLAK